MVTDAVGDLPAVQSLLQRCGARSPRPPLKNANGIEPELDPQPERDAAVRPGAGSTRRPIAARNGLASLPIISTASPTPTGRSTQIVVRLPERDVDAELVGQRGLDDLLLHLAVERDGDLLAHVVLPQVDQRVLLGELGERGVQRAVGRAAGTARRPSPASAARTGAPARPARGWPIGVADPDVAEAPELADLARADLGAPDRAAALEDADRGDLASVPSPQVAAGRAPAPCRRTSARTRPSPRPVRARP